ncbi:MAG: PIN domain-containing protein [Candidatus Accumulibacter necessarius]|jgi:predicted nucleic acid-binding protein|uniref:PIN domain-containing protein n=1 Tax=Candidatus Accumulibacter necessarius TaxID=2954386 RepID=UPI002FC38784
MSVPEHFFDTNILLYLLSGDDAKADAAEALIGEGGHLSVQVLNEFASVATRKLDMTHAEVRDVLAPIRAICQVHALTEVTHELGVHLAERYRLSIYDGMIAAAALDAGCTTLFSEDMQDGLLIERSLRIRNPFRVT